MVCRPCPKEEASEFIEPSKARVDGLSRPSRRILPRPLAAGYLRLAAGPRGDLTCRKAPKLPLKSFHLGGVSGTMVELLSICIFGGGVRV